MVNVVHNCFIKWHNYDKLYNQEKSFLVFFVIYIAESKHGYRSKAIWYKATKLTYLDLNLESHSERRLRTKLYDKRDDFNVSIVNFPFICSNIPATPAYGVYISQLIQYSITCGSYPDFHDRGFLLIRKLLNQGVLLATLQSSLRQFYGRHHDLVDCHKWPRIFSSCRNHFWVLASLMTYHRI